MFLNDRLAPTATYGFSGGPTFRTRIRSLRNQRERRNAEWMLARHVYSLPFQNIDEAALKELRRMFYAARGKLHTFRLRDPNDYQATNEPFGNADGVRTAFQLSKRSVADGLIYDRVVTLPVNAVITVNGAASAPTVNTTTGQVIFATAPASGVLRWSGQFDVKVRFDQDELPFSLDTRSHGVARSNGSINLIEVFDD